MPAIYIDVLFFINFVLDSTLLVITGRFSGKNLSPLRIVAGGLVGGIYSVSVFFASLSFLSSGIIKIAVSALMICISFSFSSAKEFFRLLLCFYLSAFLMGGTVAAVFYFLGRPGIMSNGVYYFPLSTLQLMFVGLPLGMVLSLHLKKTKNRLMSFGKHCTVTIICGENKLTSEGLIDTGCSLTDPYFNRPAIIIDPEMVQKLFAQPPPFRLIPYSTIRSGGLLKAFSPDLCIIYSAENEFVCNCTVAISPEFSGGKIIINPDVFSSIGGVKNDL